MYNKIIKVVVSGYFVLLHAGHIQYIEKAAKLGSVIVIVNNDDQQKLKYGKVIVPLWKRLYLMQSIEKVALVYPSIDKDRSVCKTLEMIKPDIFAKGGDRKKEEIPEKEICEKLGIKIVDGLGDKIESSSNLIKKVQS